MAEKIINNPSLLPSDLAFELSGNTITAISGHPVAGSGGGTVSDLVYYPVFDNSNGNVTFHLGTSAHGPEPGGAWHISGADGVDGISPKVRINSDNIWEVSEDGGETWASTGVEATGPQGEQGIRGIQGIPGVDGKNPVFEIDSNNAHWKWKYAEATSGWTDTQVVASGAVGPKGEDGISPKVQINPNTNMWEVSKDGGTTWESTGVEATGPAGQDGTNGTDGKDGKDGTNGKDGVSPTVSSEQVTGGTEVTFTYGTGQTKTITVLNGIDGASGASGASGYSPTVTTSEISPTTQHPQGGTSVTITDFVGAHQFDIWNGLNGEGATVNLLEGTGIQITENETDYTIGVSADYALKSELPDVTDMATQTWVGQHYYKKTETSGSTELSTEFAKKVNNPDTSLTDKYLVLRTDTNGAVSGWCNFNDKIYSKTESDGRYMQKNTDSTLSGDGTTNNPLGIDTTNMAASKQYAFTTTGWAEVSAPTIPDITANNGLSATGHTVGISTTNIDANKQYAWTTTGWQLVSVPTIPDIMANNGLSANGHTVGISNNGIDANKQYAWTTNGWEEVVDYLPTSGGTVSGQLVVSGGGNFDQQFLKITRENVNGYGRIGLGSSGPLAFKVDDANSHTTQINISPNTTNDQLVQVQHNSNTVGYLIPAIIEQAGWTPSTDDKILHIVLASE